MSSRLSPPPAGRSSFLGRQLLLRALAVLSLLGVAGLPLFPGCTVQDDPAGPARVALAAREGALPVFLAEGQTRLPPQQLRLIEVADEDRAGELLRLKAVEAAVLSLHQALRISAGHLPLELLLALGETRGELGLMLRPGLEQLAGARVALERPSGDLFILGQILAQAGAGPGGLTPSDLNLVTSTAILDDWQAGRLDGVLATEPLLSALEAQGGKLLATNLALPPTTLVLVARSDALDRNTRAALTRLADAWQQLRGLPDTPDDGLTALQDISGMSPGQLEDDFVGLRLLTCADNQHLFGSGALAERARHTGTLLRRFGLLQGEPALGIPARPLLGGETCAL